MARFALIAPLLLLAAAPAVARDVGTPRGPAPEKNYSNLHADVAWVVKAFETAGEAADAGDYASAARELQGVIDTRASRESPTDAAPYVRAVNGTTVFEGAWITARHAIARWGTAGQAAYQGEFGGTADTLLAEAALRRDERALVEIADRFLGLAAGRRAALLLIDLAFERADADAASGWLEALEDLEAVSGEDPARLEPWRMARVQRHAHAIARDAAAIDAVRAAIHAKADWEPLVDRVPPSLRRRAAPPTAWLTTGGDNTRGALVDGLGHRFRLGWFKPKDAHDDLVDSQDPTEGQRDRPSVWLPPRAVATPDHLFVSDGEHLHVYDLDNGSRILERSRATRHPGAPFGGIGIDSAEDRRIRFGLLEGHTLTLHPVRDFQAEIAGVQRSWTGEGWIVLCAVPDGRRWTGAWDIGRETGPRDDHIQAYYWDGGRRNELVPIWRAGGTGHAAGDLEDDTRLYGAPILYRDKVWVAGVRPARATTDRLEAWLFGLDPHTGRALSRTHIGTGTPVRTGRTDEVVPTSPAAAHGRVVVGTALGMVAAVDAKDGRLHWVYRYDRAVETERGHRRNRDFSDDAPRASSFANEPPILSQGRCYVTPTDSNELLILLDRPRGSTRTLSSHDQDRLMIGWDFLAEHIAGVAPGTDTDRPQLVVVGKGEHTRPPGPLVVSVGALDRASGWPGEKERESRSDVWRSLLNWREESPTGFGPDPYGRALVTREEVFVPTYYGIAIYELQDRDGDGTHYLGVLDKEDMLVRAALEPPEKPYGNLIPLPGRGFAAVSATTIAVWVRR
jgi:hypothetical protein